MTRNLRQPPSAQFPLANRSVDEEPGGRRAQGSAEPPLDVELRTDGPSPSDVFAPARDPSRILRERYVGHGVGDVHEEQRQSRVSSAPADFEAGQVLRLQA